MSSLKSWFVSLLASTWPRLQAASERPHWIRVDFERYEDEDDSEKEEGEGQEVEPGKKERMVSGCCHGVFRSQKMMLN